MSDTFCIIPWLHLNTWPNGKVYQCCITDWTNSIGDLTETPMKDVWNNDYMKALRLDLLAGRKGSGCSKCYEQEDHDIISSRKTFNKNFAEHIPDAKENTLADGTVPVMALRYWDFRFSNLCNMKCRMCGGHLSSLWNADEKALYGHASEPKGVVNVNDTSIDNIYKILDEHIEVVEEIYFAGGEPLIMDEHYYILDKLIELGRTDIRLRYNTNLAKLSYKGRSVVDLWDQFDNVHVIASVDAYEGRAEYIRKGTVWNTVYKNIQTLLQTDSITLGFSPTINVFNVWHIVDFVEYLLDLGVSTHSIHLNNVLTGPEWYHIAILDNTMKKALKKRLLDHVNSITDVHVSRDISMKYDGIISYLHAEIPHVADRRAEFIKKTKQLDELRGDDLLLACPELRDFYNGIYHD